MNPTITVRLTVTFDSSTTTVAEAAALPGHVISIPYVRVEKWDKRHENAHEVHGFKRSLI